MSSRLCCQLLEGWKHILDFTYLLFFDSPSDTSALSWAPSFLWRSCSMEKVANGVHISNNCANAFLRQPSHFGMQQNYFLFVLLICTSLFVTQTIKKTCIQELRFNKNNNFYCFISQVKLALFFFRLRAHGSEECD